MSLSGYEKAAIFLSSVGEEAATEVLKYLNMDDIGKISHHITRLKRIKQTAVVEVLKTQEIMRGDMHLEVRIQRVLSKR
jgi:flagellar motor switch protein FliG